MSVANRRWLAVPVVTAWMLSGVAGASEARGEFTALLSGLYRRYAWVAMFSVEASAGKVPLARASREELAEIFAPDLALAIWNDSECIKIRGEICALDFDVLFDSQDPSARDLHIESGKSSADAQVCFKDATDAQRCLQFAGAPIDGQIRIADIRYTGGQSLREMLRLPSMATAR